MEKFTLFLIFLTSIQNFPLLLSFYSMILWTICILCLIYQSYIEIHIAKIWNRSYRLYVNICDTSSFTLKYLLLLACFFQVIKYKKKLFWLYTISCIIFLFTIAVFLTLYGNMVVPLPLSDPQEQKSIKWQRSWSAFLKNISKFCLNYFI